MQCIAMSGTTRSQWATGRLRLDCQGTEAQWIKQAQHGDMNSFNRLVSEYQERIYRFAYRVLGDAAAAGDATQQAFGAAHRHLHSFRGNSLRVWLMSCIIRACRERLLRQPPLNGRPLQAHPVRGAAQGPGHEPSRATADNRALDAVIQLGLATLSFDDRITLVLADMEAFSYEEIAEITATRTDAVQSRLSNARTQLARFLTAYADQLPAAYRPAKS